VARDSLRWTQRVLSDSARAYLASLPRLAELPGGVVAAHGSLDDPEKYVLDADDAASELDAMRRSHPGAFVLMLGHTHRPFASDGVAALHGLREGRQVALGRERAWVLNPGAVGQSRQTSIRSRFMVLDLERREAVFRASSYDVRAARRRLRSYGLSAAGIHVPPWRPRTLVRRARRAASRLRPVVYRGQQG
jgi:hypothetical protein